uniref:Uncharacterized protein n=1 Tax=Melanopsichium pennsylvanicum 4 TaxID=1398559 RepID=A0A077QXX4_9BASI|nr:uncharacterized protein BN887_00895 [Melanopsichium pennsylvanicum 4]
MARLVSTQQYAAVRNFDSFDINH